MIAFDCLQAPQQTQPKCVVLGKPKESMSDGDKINYVLLVQAISALTHDRVQVYERVEAGILPGKCINPSGADASIH